MIVKWIRGALLSHRLTPEPTFPCWSSSLGSEDLAWVPGSRLWGLNHQATPSDPVDSSSLWIKVRPGPRVPTVLAHSQRPGSGLLEDVANSTGGS